MTTFDLTAECDSLRRANAILAGRVEVLEESIGRIRDQRDAMEFDLRSAEAERAYERRLAMAAEEQVAIGAARLSVLGDTPDGFWLTIQCADCDEKIATLGESPAHAAVMLAHQASIQFTTDGPRVVCRGCAIGDQA